LRRYVSNLFLANFLKMRRYVSDHLRAALHVLQRQVLDPKAAGDDRQRPIGAGGAEGISGHSDAKMKRLRSIENI
jgi:hypothetical protein